jgi:hypothetical protein
MGAMDKMNEMKDKAKDAVSGDKADEAVDKGAQMADEKTGGKYSDDIDKGADAVKDKMGNKQEEQQQ